MQQLVRACRRPNRARQQDGVGTILQGGGTPLGRRLTRHPLHTAAPQVRQRRHGATVAASNPLDSVVTRRRRAVTNHPPREPLRLHQNPFMPVRSGGPTFHDRSHPLAPQSTTAAHQAHHIFGPHPRHLSSVLHLAHHATETVDPRFRMGRRTTRRRHPRHGIVCHLPESTATGLGLGPDRLQAQAPPTRSAVNFLAEAGTR